MSIMCPRTTGCRSDEEEQCLKVCTIADDIASSGSKVITTTSLPVNSATALHTVSSLTAADGCFRFIKRLFPTQESPLVIF